MAATYPIKNEEDVKRFKNYFLERASYRNYCLVTVGLNTALRISDVLKFRWCDVYDFTTNNFKTYIYVIEQKTKKETYIILNDSIKYALTLYMDSLELIEPEDYIFKGRKNTSFPISRHHVFRMIQEASQALGFSKHISCHSMRKTFGYHAWKKGADPLLLMSIYNHSSFEITKRYLCIDQDDKDEIYLSMNL